MSEHLVKQPIIWVDKNEQLEKICDHWHAKNMLAIDTEFMRSRTYYPIAGLIQVNDGEQNVLIDPTTIDDFYPLIDILDNDDIVKALHSCSEDLEVFHYAFGTVPKNIIDTQVAASFCGFGASMGYGKLVQAMLNIELPKGETRSDWLKRPLSQPQIHYAAIDVEYLFVVATELIKRLVDAQRLSWVQADSKSIADNYFGNTSPSNSVLRFKSAWKLKPRALAILKKLGAWRENLAQEKNVPRSRIIKDTAMFSIAQTAPEHIGQLRKFEGLSERMIRSNGREIIQIVEDAKNMGDADLPQRLPPPLDAQERDLVDQCKSHVASTAERLDIAPEVLAKKKDYEHLMISRRDGELSLSKSLQGWRKEIIGEALLKIVNTEQT